MSLLLSPMAKNSSAGFYNGVATQSLRTDALTTKNVSRTPGSESNKKTFTFSTWFKRSEIDHVAPHTVHQLFSAQVDGNDYFAIYFQDDFKLYVQDYHTSEGMTVVPNRLFRDVSAWYHLVVAIDTTQGTDTNRVKIYVNGVQETSFATATYPDQNYDTYINDDVRHTLASNYTDNGQRFGGYWADTNLIDGLQLTPTSFGELKNGAWIPINTSGLTFGTNGFRLQFKQVGVGTASSTTIGADTSGNNNHYTSTNIVASDCAMPDSPENNFATLNPLNNPDGTFSEGNLKWLSTTTDQRIALATMPVDALGASDSYAEVRIGSKSATHWAIGVFGNPKSWNPRVVYRNDGVINRDGTDTQTGKTTFAEGDIMAMSYDVSLGIVTFYKNNSVITTETVTDTDNVQYFGCTSDSTGSSANYHWNFGADSSFQGLETAGGNADGNGIGDFAYTPPSGFLALCTSNLPEPTIGPNSDTQADDHFNTVLYTGDGATSHAITGVGFSPDWVWGKKRSATGDNWVFDTSRGATKQIATNSSNAESIQTTMLKTFDSDGFTMGNDSPGNADGTTLVAWNWKANGGTTSSNTDGSITSTVQANTDAGFSIVTYTGTGSSATVGHGLGVKPSMLIVKPRTTANDWIVYFETLGAGKFITLNNTDAESSNTTMFNNTEPTTTVFSINTPSGTFLNKSGEPYVCYAFNSVEGYSKFGSYTGNGNADGTFVYTGFRPAFLMIKRSDSGTVPWVILDNKRNIYNPQNLELYPNTNGAEVSGGTTYIEDFLSNGFKIRQTDATWNASGGTYIYMAFAKSSFKYANAR